MTKDDRGGEGVWQKMTDDDDGAGGRRQNTQGSGKAQKKMT